MLPSAITSAPLLTVAVMIRSQPRAYTRWPARTGVSMIMVPGVTTAVAGAAAGAGGGDATVGGAGIGAGAAVNAAGASDSSRGLMPETPSSSDRPWARTASAMAGLAPRTAT